MNIIEITQNDPIYLEITKMRIDELWAPFGFSIPKGFDEQEKKSRFFVSLNSSQLTGCAVISPVLDGSVRMRQLVVYPHFRKNSIGSKLTDKCERAALEMGFDRLTLFAHHDSYGFYVKKGYMDVGKWEKHGDKLQVMFMQKRLK